MSFRNFINKAGFQLRKHSPEIALGLGLGTMVAGGYLACRATYKKLPKENELHKEQLDAIQKDFDDGVIEEKEAKRFTRNEMVRHGFVLAKTYSVPIALEAGGAAAIVVSHSIISKRLASTTATLVTVSTAFAEYRNRVIDRYGEDADRAILLNEREVTVKKIDEEGNEVEETITVADPDVSGIGRYFTEENDNWSNSEELVNDMVRMKDFQLTDKFVSEGFILLNTIYDAYGFKTDTEEGITVGKVYDPKQTGQVIKTIKRKCKIRDQWGNFKDAYYLEWPDLEIIYGKGAKHRSVSTENLGYIDANDIAT